MKITVELPDDMAQRPNPGRRALEVLAIEGYRSSALTAFEAAQLLDLSRLEFENLLKQRQITEHAYDEADLARDLATIDDLAARESTDRA